MRKMYSCLTDLTGIRRRRHCRRCRRRFFFVVLLEMYLPDRSVGVEVRKI